jgi:hypothetical protein
MTRLPDPMRWLDAGIPLTLLIDLLETAGPHSDRILDAEPADVAWIPEATRAA